MFALAALSLLALAAAQNIPTGDVAIISANFQGAQLVPQLLPTFTPQGSLNVAFGSGSNIIVGDNVTQADAGSFPVLSVQPAANATDLDGTAAVYTVMMVDANVVGTDESTTNQTRHWLVNGARIGSTAPYALDYTGAATITDYAGPGPAEGSGAHRYVILLYVQPSTFAAPADLANPGTPLAPFSLSSYVSSSGLGPLVAANYFQVENGVATVTVPATTAVDTDTLAPAAASTTSMSGSMTSASKTGPASGAASATGSMSGAASGTASSAASASASGSGAARTDLGWGVVVGGLGVVGTVLGAMLI